MFLDDEIAVARPRRNEARWGFYLALAALAACIVMILGLITEATVQAAESKPQQLIRPNDMAAHVDAAASSSFISSHAATEADRQIMIGLALLAIALPSGTAFAFWRSRNVSLVTAEARRHGR